MENNAKKNLIFYEIYPTSFYDSNNDGVGDINGITSKLDYILETGFNAIWINPFYLSPFKDGGYDVVDFKAIDPRFGTFEDFKSLLKEAHKRNIKIIIDYIPGHTSENHPYFIKSGEEERNEYSDLFIWTSSVWNYNSKYKLISGRHPRDGNYLVNFFAFQPALNFGFKDIDDYSWQMSYKDPRTFKARDFCVENMLFWLDLGVDGFRVDMADSLVKNDDNKEATIEVWHYIFERIKAKYPNAFFVSEWCNPWQAFKAGFDADFVLDHHDNYYHSFIRSNEFSGGPSVLNGGDVHFFISDLLARLDIASIDNGLLALISGNHDVIRLSEYASEEKMRIYYMLMFFLPGIPFVYYGDEIGMRQGKVANKDGGYQRTGARTPFQWDDTKQDGFSKADELYLPVNKGSMITLLDNLERQDSLYYFIKELIKIRKEVINEETEEIRIEEHNRFIKIYRGNLLLTMNLSDLVRSYEGELIISSKSNKELLPYSAVITKIN